MAPKKNNNNNDGQNASDTAQDNNNNNSSQQRQGKDANNNNNSSQQRQNKDANNNKEKSGNSQRIGGDGPRANPVSRSKKAGVIFPVLRIQRMLQNSSNSAQVRNTAAVFMAGVLEYLVAEVAELAGNAAGENKRKRIIPRHIFLAIHNDEELNKVCENVTIAEGGVVPHIHQVLLHTKKSSSQSLKGDASSQKKKNSPSKKQGQRSSTGADTSADDDNTMEQ